MATIEFVSIKGKVYTPAKVLPVVLSILAKRYPHFTGSEWRAAVRKEMADPEFLRRCNGMCPAGVAYEVEVVAIIANTTAEHVRMFGAPPAKAEPAEWAANDADLANSADLARWKLQREIGAVR